MEMDGVDKTIFIGQVPLNCTQDDVLQWVSPFGTVRECRLKPGTKTHCAFVKFDKFSQAEAVVQNLNGWSPKDDGNALNVSFSKPRAQSKDQGEVVSDRKLFIGQVPKTATEADLQQLLQPFGNITQLNIHRTNGQHNGCAFCKFSSWAECEAAIEGLDQQVTMPGATKPITVAFASGRPKKAPALAGKRALDEALLAIAKRSSIPGLPLGLPASTLLSLPVPTPIQPIVPAATLPPNCEEWKLFVGQLPSDITEVELNTYFALYGDVLSVRVLRDNQTGKSKGCAFVQYSTAQSAETAMSSLDGKAQLRGKQMTVRYANPKKPTDNTPPTITPLPTSTTAHPVLNPLPLPTASLSPSAVATLSALLGLHPAIPQTIVPRQTIIPHSSPATIVPVGNASHDNSHKLFVGQVPQEYSEAELTPFFAQYGNVQSVNVLRDSQTHRSKGCCFVVYSTPEEAQFALETLNGCSLLNAAKPLTVSYAKSRN